MNKPQPVTSKTLNDLGNTLGSTLEIVTLFNDLIDLMPSVTDAKVSEDPHFYYGIMSQKLGNIFHTNQSVISNIDDVAGDLFEIAEELERIEKEGKADESKG